MEPLLKKWLNGGAGTSGSKDKKKWNELEVGKDYEETYHADNGTNYSRYIRVVKEKNTKQFGHRKYASTVDDMDSQYEVTNNDDYVRRWGLNHDRYTWDDDVPKGVSEKFDQFQEDNKIMPGDILCGIFGYSMTLPVFYRVVKRNGNTVTIQKLGHSIERTDDVGNFTAMPIFQSSDGETERRKVSTYGLAETVRCEYCTLHIWDGRPIRGNDFD